MFQAETVRWELGAKTVAVDFQLAQELTATHLQQIEDAVNAYIRENRPVSFGVFPKEALGDIALLRGEGVRGCRSVCC